MEIFVELGFVLGKAKKRLLFSRDGDKQLIEAKVIEETTEAVKLRFRDPELVDESGRLRWSHTRWYDKSKITIKEIP